MKRTRAENKESTDKDKEPSKVEEKPEEELQEAQANERAEIANLN